MVDPLVGATAQVLFEKILSLALDRIGLLFGFKKDVESLRSSVMMIQAFLADAEEKQRHSNAVEIWLKEIEGVAYEADDVFDKLNYELLRRRVETAQNSLNNKVCFFFSSSRAVTLRWKMASKVREITLKLKSINEKAQGFGLQYQLSSGSNPTVHLPNRETDSVHVQNVVGRVDDKSKILEKLFSPSVETLSFIPITGMGGLGKTTLAQFVYNDKEIDKYFDRKIWVCVSDNFDIIAIFKLILGSLQKKKVDLTSREEIVQKIKEEIKGKKYLLVLDDVWCETPVAWDDFLDSLKGTSTMKGNWCIVTTRLQTVPKIITANPPFVLEMEKLSDDECWEIFKGKAFPSAQIIPDELNASKEEIIKACRGVPLVASVIGGMLRIIEKKDEWLSIIRNEIPNMTGGMEHVMPILKLSFDHLPSASIKKCFAYCSLFKKDIDMEKDQLIQLWMAEGFLQSTDGNDMEMEVVGSRYFEILVKSSLFQEVTNANGVIFGRMHDLIHDLAELVSKSETIKSGEGVRNENCRARHLVLESLQEDVHAMLKERSSSLRTLFAKCTISNHLLFKSKSLRSLSLSTEDECMEFPKSISKLIYLRYLWFPSGIQTLPESVCKLYNLQTLKIEGYLDKLPEGMSNLISLRHFYFRINSDIQMPLRLGKLTCLETFEFFNIGREEGRRIEEIGQWTNLRGRLKIRNLELIDGKERARMANLFAKSNLTNLSLVWASNRKGDNDDENVLEGLEPHPNLQKLGVESFMGSRFPSWLTRLKKLKKLTLLGCRRCEEIPTLGQLPLLKSLNLYWLDNLRCIGSSSYCVNNCSSSDQLSITKCHNLNSVVVSWEQQLPSSLSSLVIWGCDGLSSLPAELFQSCISLQSLIIQECEGLSSLPAELFQSCISLQSLIIRECDGLSSLPAELFQSCISLESLEVCRCRNVISFPLDLGKTPSLSSLKLFRCPRLITLPKGFESCINLRKLEIDLFPTSMDWSTLPSSIRSLALYGRPDSVSLPDQLQYLTEIIDLSLTELGSIEILPDWLGNLTSLERLVLYDCGKLMHLPSMEAMRCLTNLRRLWIVGCPILKERCTPSSCDNSEWSKISHIPNIFDF